MYIRIRIATQSPPTSIAQASTFHVVDGGELHRACCRRCLRARLLPYIVVQGKVCSQVLMGPPGNGIGDAGIAMSKKVQCAGV